MSDQSAIQWTDAPIHSIVGVMAQTPEGAEKVAAKKAGVSVGEYLALRERGLKRCSACRAWHSLERFGPDRSRYDGLASKCRDSSKAGARSRYVPHPRHAEGRSYVPARDGDKLQARRRVNYFVEAGLIPSPNDLVCTDCGHTGDDRRHEYDHYLGYDGCHHEDVQAVCSMCHHARERKRTI